VKYGQGSSIERLAFETDAADDCRPISTEVEHHLGGVPPEA